MPVVSVHLEIIHIEHHVHMSTNGHKLNLFLTLSIDQLLYIRKEFDLLLILFNLNSNI